MALGERPIAPAEIGPTGTTAALTLLLVGLANIRGRGLRNSCGGIPAPGWSPGDACESG